MGKIYKKISIRTQVFLALFAVILIMAAIFSPYGFYTNVNSIRKSIDERLYVAVNGLKEILPDDYHDRLANGKVSDEEYKVLQKKVSDFKKRIGITYIYAMVMDKDSKIRFTMDTEVKLNSLYEDPSADTIEAFKTRKIVHAQCVDQDFGIASRTVLCPFFSPEGRMYILGSDLNVQQLRPMIKAALRDFFLLLLLGLVFVFIVTIILSKRISRPIQRLSDFTKKLSDSNFSPDLSAEEFLSKNENISREVQLLTDNIIAMREKLREYLANLETEMRARNIAETELKISGQIQESFLPGKEIDSYGTSAYASMKPAKQAGGDLYDFFRLDDGRICYAIGDVSGKGMPAALFMTRAMTLIRCGARNTSDIVEIANLINDMLAQNNDACSFVTFFISAFNEQNGELEYVNCGHNPPYLKHTDGNVELVKLSTNTVLGIFENLKLKSDKMVLQRGECLICYTDGVNEAVAADSSFYGDERFLNLLKNLKANSSAAEIVSAVTASVGHFASGAEQSDDITVLVIKRK